MNPIKFWRMVRGIKQRELAEKIGVSREYIGEVEVSKTIDGRGIGRMKKICDVLEIKLDDLYNLPIGENRNKE